MHHNVVIEMLYIGLYIHISLWERYDVSRIFILFYTNHCRVQFWLRSTGMCFFSLFFSFSFLIFTLKRSYKPVLGYIHIVLSYSAPSNQDYIFFLSLSLSSQAVRGKS